MTNHDLKYLDESSLCLLRQSQGESFKFIDQDGQPIKDEATLARIKALVIPPNWRKVAVCSDEWGHIQAVGYDAKGRKQYRYHQLWQEQQQEVKFNRMLEFGEVLPTLRRTITAHMNLRGLPSERVISTVVWLLENTFIRIGNQEYAQNNQSYGLTTLREKHVQVSQKGIEFQFKGKSGVYHVIGIDNPKVSKTIQKCIDLPGYEIFQYLDDNGQRHVVDSRTINDYLHGITGEQFSAKDFRTWGGTVLAATTLYDAGSFESETEAKKKVVGAIKDVASHLGNKPATCRKYYIHPTVLETYQTEILIPHFETVLKDPAALADAPARLHKKEAATWTLLKQHPPKN